MRVVTIVHSRENYKFGLGVEGLRSRSKLHPVLVKTNESQFLANYQNYFFTKAGINKKSVGQTQSQK